MGFERKMIVCNSGPLIHLAKIDRLKLLKEKSPDNIAFDCKGCKMVLINKDEK